MDQIYLRAGICSDYYREEDQLDTIYEENWPLYLNTHTDVEYFNYMKIYVCFRALNNVENLILDLSMCIAEWRELELWPYRCRSCYFSYIYDLSVHQVAGK